MTALQQVPVEEEVEGYGEHFPGFGEALGAPVEARQIVADGGIGCLDKVGLGFGLGMRCGDAVTLKGEAVARVGVGEDRGDVGDDTAGALVEFYGAGDTFVADMPGNNATLCPAISSPYDRPALFFWTKV